MEKSQCKYCNFIVFSNYYFCPNCGKKLHEPPLPTGIGKQIGIYALSILLPPLGLWPGLKYLFQKNDKAKIIGLIAISLTILSTVITLWVTMNFLTNPFGSDTGRQLQELQNLGY